MCWSPYAYLLTQLDVRASMALKLHTRLASTGVTDMVMTGSDWKEYHSLKTTDRHSVSHSVGQFEKQAVP